MKVIEIDCEDGKLLVLLETDSMRIEDDYDVYIRCAGRVSMKTGDKARRIRDISEGWPEREKVRIACKKAGD